MIVDWAEGGQLLAPGLAPLAGAFGQTAPVVLAVGSVAAGVGPGRALGSFSGPGAVTTFGGPGNPGTDDGPGTPGEFTGPGR